MSRRKSGEGSWGKKTIKGIEYEYFKKSYNGEIKYFYGKSHKEIKDKVKAYEKTIGLNSDATIRLMTFYEYATKWLKEEKKDEIAHKTYDSYEHFIEKFLKDSDIGEMQIKKIITLENKKCDSIFKDFFDSLAKEKSSSVVNTGFTIINQTFEYGIANDIFNYNPLLRVKKPKSSISKKVIESLNMEEVEMLWNEMLRVNTRDSIITGKEGTPVYGFPAYILLFMCYTGLRTGEVTGLHREYVNKEEKFATIKSQVVFIKNRRKDETENKNIWIETLPKGNKERIIPLADRAIEIINMVEKRYPEIKSGVFQFSRTGNPVSESNLNRTLQGMCKRVGITKKVTPHVLRHSFASILLNDDEQSLPVISEILGHSSVEVTHDVYIDIFLEKKMKTISLFNKASNKEDKENKE